MKKTYNTPSIEIVRSDVQALLLTVSPGDATPNSPVLSKESGLFGMDDDEDNE